MRVISCESVLCSAAARRRKDSFKWLGTYAPMKTPLRFAIYRSLSFENLVKRWECLAPSEVEQVCKPNSVSRCFRVGMAIIHLVQLLPVGSSDLPGGRISLFTISNSRSQS